MKRIIAYCQVLKAMRFHYLLFSLFFCYAAFFEGKFSVWLVILDLLCAASWLYRLWHEFISRLKFDDDMREITIVEHSCPKHKKRKDGKTYVN